MTTLKQQSLLILSFLIARWMIVESSHFYGGTVTWKPVNNSATTGTVDVMFTQSYQWRRSWSSGGGGGGGSGFCDQTIIQNKSPLIPATGATLDCVSGSCGGYTPIPIDEYCTDFSTLVDASSGQISTVRSISSGSKFCVAFQAGAWIRVLSTKCSSTGRKKRAINTTGLCFENSADWSVGTCLDLTVRPGGFINTPPVATVISPINVMVDTLTEIRIPVIDSDNDFLRCRWAVKNSTFDECGDVCQAVPGATLHPNNCSITFNSTGADVDDYFAVTLMVEDFADANSTTPFSSVPIQFLIHIVNASTCSIKPTINSSLPSCSIVEVGVQFNFTLVIEQGCPGTTLQDVFTMPPLFMYKGSITPGPTSTSWTVSETWVADASQLGSQVFCALATDSGNIQSDQYCLTFTVIPAGSNQQCPGVTTIATTISAVATTSTNKRENPSWTGLIIALSILGFLGLLTACCCFWWWLFARAAAARRRRRHLTKGENLDTAMQPVEKPFSNDFHRSRSTTLVTDQGSILPENHEMSALGTPLSSRPISMISMRSIHSTGKAHTKVVPVRPDYDHDVMSNHDQDSKISDTSSKPIIPPSAPLMRDKNEQEKSPETRSARTGRRFSISVVRVPRAVSRAFTAKRGHSTDAHAVPDHRSDLSHVPTLPRSKTQPTVSSSLSHPTRRLVKVIQTQIRPKKR